MGFTGQEVRLPMAEYGLVGSKNLNAVPPTALIRALNVAYDLGVIGREGGSAKYNATPITGGPKILALLDWWPTSVLQRVLAVTVDGKVLRDTGAGDFATTMKTGLSASMLPMWCEGGTESFGNTRKAFLTTGLNVVQVVSADAVTTADLTTPPADWSGANQPRFLVLAFNRLWGGLAHRMYKSTVTNHEDFTGAGAAQLAVKPGLGQYLQGAVEFKELLFVWKWPRGLAFIDDADNLDLLTDAIGLAGPKALCAVDDDVLFLSEIGHLHLLSHVRQNDIEASDLTAANELGPWVRDNVEVDASQLQFAEARYYPDRKEAHVALRGKGATRNTLRLVVDFNRPRRPRIRHSDKDVAESLTLWRDTKGVQRLLSGDDAGTVWKLDQAARDKAGAGYASEFQTVQTDFGHHGSRLNFSYLDVTMAPTGNWDLQVDTILDGIYGETLAFNMGITGAVLGSFILGTDALAGEFVRHRRRRMRGSAFYLSLKGRVSAAGQDFNVQDMLVGFTPGGSRPR